MYQMPVQSLSACEFILCGGGEPLANPVSQAGFRISLPLPLRHFYLLPLSPSPFTHLSQEYATQTPTERLRLGVRSYPFFVPVCTLKTYSIFPPPVSSSDLPARTRSQTRLGSRPPAVGAGTASAPGCSTGICGIANTPVSFLVRYVGGTKGALGWIGGRTAPSAGCHFRLWVRLAFFFFFLRRAEDE